MFFLRNVCELLPEQKQQVAVCTSEILETVWEHESWPRTYLQKLYKDKSFLENENSNASPLTASVH